MRILSIILVSVLMTANAHSADGPFHNEVLQIDHFVIGIADLDKGIRQFEELTGVRPAYGGEHPNMGTHNALVSLGGRTYLEILAPRPGAYVDASLQHLTGLSELTPVAWAVSTSDVAQTIDRLNNAGFESSEPSPGSRQQVIGSMLNWTVFTLEGRDLARAPFFIEWGETAIHPSQTSPGGCAMGPFEITDPVPDQLQDLMQALGLFVTVVHDADPMLMIDLVCPNGEIQFGR